jgi:hypothetical protein
MIHVYTMMEHEGMKPESLFIPIEIYKLNMLRLSRIYSQYLSARELTDMSGW